MGRTADYRLKKVKTDDDQTFTGVFSRFAVFRQPVLNYRQSYNFSELIFEHNGFII
jgi:hypothetical protein